MENREGGEVEVVEDLVTAMDGSRGFAREASGAGRRRRRPTGQGTKGRP